MKKVNKVLAIILVCFLTEPLVGSAQDSIKLNLEKAIELGLTNSKQLKLAAAKVDEAVAVVKQAEDRRLPDFNISGSYLRLNHANIDMASSASNSSGAKTGPKVNQAMYGSANLSIPVYAGGRIKYGIESAKYLEKAVQLDAENDKEEVIYNTVAAYVNYYKATEAVKIVRENLDYSKRRDKDFSNLEKNGLMARNDLLRAELQTSNFELALLDAEKGMKIALVNMNMLLGLPESISWLPDSSFIDKSFEVKDISALYAIAFQNRKDLQALGERQKAAEAGTSAVKGEMKPSLALTGGYIAGKITDLITITNAVNIGAGIQFPVSNLWKSKAKINEAKAKELQLQITREIMTDGIKQSLHSDYEQYFLTRKKVDVYKKALEQAAENFRITTNKYNNNLVTITELLDANLLLLQAKLEISIAKADELQAYNKLLLSAGLLN